MCVSLEYKLITPTKKKKKKKKNNCNGHIAHDAANFLIRLLLLSQQTLNDIHNNHNLQYDTNT